MVFELVLSGHRDNTYPVPDMEALAACLIFWILAAKKEANSLQVLADKSSEATDTGGFVVWVCTEWMVHAVESHVFSAESLNSSSDWQ